MTSQIKQDNFLEYADIEIDSAVSELNSNHIVPSNNVVRAYVNIQDMNHKEDLDTRLYNPDRDMHYKEAPAVKLTEITVSWDLSTAEYGQIEIENVRFKFATMQVMTQFVLKRINTFWTDVRKKEKQTGDIRGWKDFSAAVANIRDHEETRMIFKEPNGDERGIIVEKETVTFFQETKGAEFSVNLFREQCISAFKAIAEEERRLKHPVDNSHTSL